MESKVIDMIWYIDNHIGEIVGITLAILFSPIIIYLLYLVCDYFYTYKPKKKKKIKRHCYSCGGKLKFSHMSYSPIHARIYKCTQCSRHEWVLCKDIIRRYN